MPLPPHIVNHVVPQGGITLWWLGQSGLILKSPSGKIAAIDPYLTNSCKAIGDRYGFDLDRLTPPPIAPEQLVGIDLYALSHSHDDHLDPETLAGYRAAGGSGPFLAPHETADKLRAAGVPDEQIIVTWPNQTCQIGDFRIRTTLALPYDADDLTHVGYIVRVDSGPTIYVTGDTAFHESLYHAAAPDRPDILFTVINGAFRNLGPAEAARLAKMLDVKIAIPCHYDLFADNSLPPRLFHTNLKTEGLGDRYRRLDCGVAWTHVKR
ncbi:MAG: MBL fold metallo-hydrolase [Pirellulales bacterium]|nr:MBL fold metallo-hydrolase [Pirellulales bacterium]